MCCAAPPLPQTGWGALMFSSAGKDWRWEASRTAGIPVRRVCSNLGEMMAARVWTTAVDKGEHTAGF